VKEGLRLEVYFVVGNEHFVQKPVGPEEVEEGIREGERAGESLTPAVCLLSCKTENAIEDERIRVRAWKREVRGSGSSGSHKNQLKAPGDRALGKQNGFR